MQKNRLKLQVCTFICAVVVFAGCGGGSSDGGSKVKKNEFLGSLPSIYANFYAAEKADEEKMEKLAAKGDVNKILKEAEKLEKEEKARNKKLKTDVSAEIAKIVGKEIPFSFSKALQDSKELYYSIAPTKLVEHNGDLAVAFSISSKNSFEVARMGGYDYTVYFRFIAADGSTITKSVLFAVPLQSKPLSVKEGELLLENNHPLNIAGKPETWANFAGIEFITKAEYDGE